MTLPRRGFLGLLLAPLVRGRSRGSEYPMPQIVDRPSQWRFEAVVHEDGTLAYMAEGVPPDQMVWLFGVPPHMIGELSKATFSSRR